LLSGCGLESFLVLSAPTPILSGRPSLAFQFKKETYNNELDSSLRPAFLGFELYYKIYGMGESPDNDNDIATFDQLGPRGFRRINNNLTDQYPSYHRPLIDMSSDSDPNRSAEFLITIDFNADLTNADASADFPKIYPDASAPNPGPITINAIRRDENYSYVGLENEFKRFSADSRPYLVVFEAPPTDNDLSAAAWSAISTFPYQAKIALYVLSYGFDQDTNSVLYSLPVFLGSLDTVVFPHP
jgi:hypothetical protein